MNPFEASEQEILNGSFDNAMRVVSTRAVYRQLEKRALEMPDLSALWGQAKDYLGSLGAGNLGDMAQKAWANPDIKRGLIGAGTGAGLGLLSTVGSDRPMLPSALLGGLLGGGAGVIGGRGYDWATAKPPTPEELKKREARRQAAIQAQEAKWQLGLRGVPEDKVNQISSRMGKPASAILKRADPQPPLSEGEATTQLQSLVPGGDWTFEGPSVPLPSLPEGQRTQLSNSPEAATIALRHGRPLDAVNQMDVLGLKNYNPMSPYGSMSTFAGGVGLNLGGRALNTVRHATMGTGENVDRALSTLRSIPGLQSAPIVGNWMQNRSLASGSLSRNPVGSGPGAMLTADDLVRLKTITNTNQLVNPMRDQLARQYGGHLPAMLPLSSPDAVSDFVKRYGKEIVPEKLPSAVTSTSPLINTPKEWQSELNIMKALKNQAPVGATPKAPGSDPLGIKSVWRAGSRAIGGPGGLAAFMLPAMVREWFGQSGYRSGSKPIADLVEANRVLNQK